MGLARATAAAVLLVGAATLSCDAGRVSSSAGPTGGATSSGTSQTTGAETGQGVCNGGEGWQDSDSATVFAGGGVADYALTLSAADWQQLQDNALDEVYVEADLTAEGCDVGSVGLRFKGGYGTLQNCFDDQGNRTCDKLSMKIKFDFVDTTKRYHGLKRLNFHSLIHDRSLMHDRLGYAMFRDMGVDAPRSSHATVRVNGELLGVFGLVEAVDGRFTDNRFDPGDGNLYKEVWPTSTDPQAYESALQTNEGLADHTGMVAFATALGAASDAELPAVLEQYTDPLQLMRFVAVDRAISNWDGMMAWYCSQEWGGCGNHNLYWYQQQGAQRFQLIPWDLDNTFGLHTPFDGIPTWTQDPPDCAWLLNDFAEVRSPACDPLIRGLAATDRDLYLDAVAQLLDGPFQLATLEARLDAWELEIADAVANDPTVAKSFSAGMQQLRNDLPLLRQRLQNTLDGTPSVPFALAVDALNDFESTDPLGLALGAEVWVAEGSIGAAALEQLDPISGTADARFSFEFRDGATPWGQAALMRFGLEGGGIQDLTGAGVVAIRLRARADSPRTLRVDLDSPAHSLGDMGHRFGWVLDLGPTAQTFDLVLDAATMPPWALPTNDVLGTVLQQVRGLGFMPGVLGLDAQGLLGDGASDPGWVEVEDVEFVKG